MPNFCLVVGCGSRGERDNVKFFRVPSVKNTNNTINPLKLERRERWITALKREDLTENKLKNGRICSRHFHSGQPCKLEDRDNLDWVPSINMGYDTFDSKQAKAHVERHDRVKRRRVLKEIKEMECNPETPGETDHVFEGEVNREDVPSLEEENHEFLRLQSQIANQEKELNLLRNRLQNLVLDENRFKEEDPAFVLYYTGFPQYKYIESLCKVLHPYQTETDSNKLSKFQQTILTLMKLRLNFQFTDLGYRFGIHRTTASRIFYRNISIMYSRLKSLVIWPDREDLRKNVPQCFRENFGESITVIIDCFEVNCEKPSNPEAGCKMWSNYKQHITVKYLIGITPQGVISFISKAYGGRASDKFITEDCGLLSNLLPGDKILADRGFLIEDSVKFCYAEVIRPAFKGRRNQISPIEIEETRKIANVRIHVERVIGLFRQKYTIFANTLGMNLVQKKDNGISVLDKLVVVCAALINLGPSIIPQ